VIDTAGKRNTWNHDFGSWIAALASGHGDEMIPSADWSTFSLLCKGLGRARMHVGRFTTLNLWRVTMQPKDFDLIAVY